MNAKVLSVCVLAGLVGVGCTEDEKSKTEIPEAAEKMTPAVGAPVIDERYGPMDAGAFEFYDADIDANFECCMVTFAIADATNDETSAYLKGGDVPLAGDGVELTWADGKWSADVCMPPRYGNIYYYEFSVPADDENDPPFVFTRANGVAPTTQDEVIGEVNNFERKNTCADVDVEIHATTRPDECDKGFFGDNCQDFMSIGGKDALLSWNFDDGSGTTSDDGTSNNLDGTIVNGNWVADDRVQGESVLSLSGNGSVTGLFPAQADGTPAGPLFIPQGDVSFSMWMKTSNATVEGLMYIASTEGGCDRTVGSNGTTLSANAWDDVNFSGSTVVNDGDWHHVVYVLDQGTGLYLYVDGQEEASSTDATNNCGVGCSGFSYANQFIAGTGGGCRFNADGFVGSLDDVAVWNGALSAAEVAELYENQTP